MLFMSHSYNNKLSNKLLEKQQMINMIFPQKQNELNQKTQGSSQCRVEDPLKKSKRYYCIMFSIEKSS